MHACIARQDGSKAANELSKEKQMLDIRKKGKREGRKEERYKGKERMQGKIE